MEAPSDPLASGFSSMNELSLELSSLQDLASRGSWRSILDKVARARSQSLLRHPHDHLLYLSFNALSLLKLRRFHDASAEVASLDDLDSAHYRFESYPNTYPSRSGSMVPFALRFLHALLPIKLGLRQEGLDRLYLLLHFLRRKIDSALSGACLDVWRRREVFLINCLIGEHLMNKEYSVCFTFINDLLRRHGLDPFLLSKLGYIQMQIGDLEGAKASFDRVEGFLKEQGSNGLVGVSDNELNKGLLKEDGRNGLVGVTDNELKNLVNRNRALVYMVGKDYVSAVREYDECIERDCADVVAVNNKALCLMYLRDLSDSVKVLENALERVPTAALNETVVVNLCSMYELAYVNHSDVKKTLSNWIARVAPDDFDSSCTRI